MSDPFLSIERKQTAQAAAMLRENPLLLHEVTVKLGQGKNTPPDAHNLDEASVAGGAASNIEGVILPGSGVTIKDAAEALFKRIAPTNTIFIRGGAVTGIAQHNGTSSIVVISPAAARSRFESYATFGYGELVAAASRF